jgi:Ca2+-binding RTX toxin-like protein|tara:strand:+ start:120 stop:452 length:333 start_codon:yes stop_codon:yes gene_type:complete
LYGTASDNVLDGGTGADTLYTGDGSDTIVLRAGDGGSTLAAADTITDFTDGTDVFGLDDGLQYTDLTIAQGTSSNSSDTIISAGAEYLAILTGTNVSALSEADFTPVDIV